MNCRPTLHTHCGSMDVHTDYLICTVVQWSTPRYTHLLGQGLDRHDSEDDFRSGQVGIGKSARNESYAATTATIVECGFLEHLTS